MNEFFSGLVASAKLAIAVFYANIFSEACSLHASELADWYQMEESDLLLDESDGPVFAKRLTLPVWDLVGEDAASAIASDVMAEYENRMNGDLFISSHTGDNEFVVYLCSHEVEHDLLRIAFDDIEEQPELEEEEEDDERTPEGGRMLSVVPRIGQRQETAPVETLEEEEVDFPLEPDSDFPLEEQEEQEEVAEQAPQTAPAEAQTEQPVGEAAPAPESAPEAQEEAPAVDENQAMVDRVVEAITGTASAPAEAPAPEPEPEPQGPKKESPEILAAIHAEKMQQVIDMLPSDTISDTDSDGVLTIMYTREINGEQKDYIRTVKIENENFNNVRYVDVFYVYNESGQQTHRSTNAGAAVQSLENLTV